MKTLVRPYSFLVCPPMPKNLKTKSKSVFRVSVLENSNSTVKVLESETTDVQLKSIGELAPKVISFELSLRNPSKDSGPVAVCSPPGMLSPVRVSEAQSCWKSSVECSGLVLPSADIPVQAPLIMVAKDCQASGSKSLQTPLRYEPAPPVSSEALERVSPTVYGNTWSHV